MIKLEAAIVIISLISLLVLLLTIGAPIKSMNVIGHIVVRVVIGVLFLFFFNVFAASFGLHIPINVFTVLVSSILGIFGVTSLAAIHIFIL